MSTKTKHKHHARRGFTLIEIIVVVMIITILATLIAPKLLGRVCSAKQAAAKAKAVTIAQKIELYHLDSGLTSPSNDFELDLLLLTPDNGGGPSGPYLNKADDIIDPWGKAFEIEMPGTVNYDYDIISWGEDGEAGGEACDEDITQ